MTVSTPGIRVDFRVFADDEASDSFSLRYGPPRTAPRRQFIGGVNARSPNFAKRKDFAGQVLIAISCCLRAYVPLGTHHAPFHLPLILSRVAMLIY